MKRIALELLPAMLCIASVVMAADNAGNPSPSRPAQVGPVPAEPPATTMPAAATTMPSPAMTALTQAAAEKKYLFVFFYKADDANTRAMRKVFDDALAKSADKANSIAVNIGDAAEKATVDKFGVARAPMPLALAVAPNGAVTAGLPTKFDEKDLAGAFVSPGKEKCLKALQNRKLVIICAQNQNTKSNDEATKGVQEFTADKRYSGITEVIQVDPADAAEAKLMAEFKIDPQTKEAVTVLMAPPGAVMSIVQGKVNKDALIAALNPPKSGGCGCGPGGCK